MTKAWQLLCVGVFDDDMDLEKVGNFVEVATNHKVTVQEVKLLPKEVPSGAAAPMHWMDRIYCLEDAVRELAMARTAAHGQSGRIGKMERKLTYQEGDIGRLKIRVERLEQALTQNPQSAGYITLMNKVNELEDEVRLYVNGYNEMKRQAEAFEEAQARTTDVSTVGWSFTCTRCKNTVTGPVTNPTVEWLCDKCAENDATSLPSRFEGDDE